MRSIGRYHAALSRCASDVQLGALANGDVVERLRRAVAEGSVKASCREHPLQPSLVLWLVLGMSLWRDLSIPNVLRRLLAPWRRSGGDLPLDPVTDGALAHARKRLGPEPLRRFFEEGAAGVRPEPSFHGRRLWAIDGVRCCVPDTERNARAFGRQTRRGQGIPLPQLLAITLICVSTHRMRAACILPCHTGERDPGLRLLEHLGRGDLALMDRGFYAAWLIRALEARGIEYCIRLPSTVKARKRRRLGPHMWEVEIHTRYRREGSRRLKRRRLGRVEEIAVSGRMIEYRMRGAKETVRLLTNVTDEGIGAIELACLYHERWEVEVANDEIKTHLASVRHGTQRTVARGKSPELVKQEMWALFALYNLLREQMERAATRAGTDPRRLGFVDCAEAIRRAVDEGPAASDRPATGRYTRLLDDMADCAQRRWRRHRRSPRAIRARRQRFRTKRPRDRCTPFNFMAALERSMVE